MHDIIEIAGNNEGCDFVSTDPHGSLNEMKQVLGLLRQADRLLLCGDYVDRGKDSLGLIRYLKKQKQQGKSIFMIRGNHEDMMLKTLQDIDLMMEMYKGAEPFGDSARWQHYCTRADIRAAYPWAKSLDKAACRKLFGFYSHLRWLYRSQYDSLLVENKPESNCYEREIRDYLNHTVGGYYAKGQSAHESLYDFLQQLFNRMSNGQAWIFSLRSTERAEVQAFIAHDQMPYGIRVKEAYQGEKTIQSFDLFHAAPLSDERIGQVLSGDKLTTEEIQYVTWARPPGYWQEGDVRMLIGDILPKLFRTYLGHNVNGLFVSWEVYKAIKAFNLDLGTADSRCILAYDHTNDRVHLIGKPDDTVKSVMTHLCELAKMNPSYAYVEGSNSARELYHNICQEVWQPHFSLSQFKQAIKNKILTKKIENEMSEEQRIFLAYFLLTSNHVLAQERSDYRKNDYSIDTGSMLKVIWILLGGIENRVNICEISSKTKVTFFNSDKTWSQEFTIKQRNQLKPSIK